MSVTLETEKLERSYVALDGEPKASVQGRKVSNWNAVKHWVSENKRDIATALFVALYVTSIVLPLIGLGLLLAGVTLTFAAQLGLFLPGVVVVEVAAQTVEESFRNKEKLCQQK